MTLAWTTNGRMWLALCGGQYAAIEKAGLGTIRFEVTIGNLVYPDMVEVAFNLDEWRLGSKWKTLEEAQAWAAEKLGVKE